MRNVFVLSIAVYVVACSSGGTTDSGAPACQLNDTRSCLCVAGGMGVETCDGSGQWSTCVCPDVDSGVSADASDASTCSATMCDSGCVDTTSDPNNCGACGMACASGQQCQSGTCMMPTGPVQVSWSFPGFFTDETGTMSLFPTYLSRLYDPAPAPSIPFQFQLACASLTNTSDSTQSVDLTVGIPTYASTATHIVSVPPMGTMQECFDPVFNFPTLDDVRAMTPSGLQLTASMTGAATPFSMATQPFSILPSNDVVWVQQGMLNEEQMRGLSAVFVRPNDPTVMQIRSEAEPMSMWGTFFAPPFVHSSPPLQIIRNAAVPASTSSTMTTFLEAAESMVVTCQSDQPVSMYVMDDAQFASFSSTGARSAGATAQSVTASRSLPYLAPAEGTYHFVVTNDGSVMANITQSREASYFDAATNVLSATFTALEAHHIAYSSIAQQDLAGIQTIRSPSETVAMMAGNCIDGSLLMASVFEEIGFEPRLLYFYGCADPSYGHAMVGVHVPGSQHYWPIETTLLQTGTQPSIAISAALNTIQAHTDCVHVFDVAALRAANITPGM